MTELRDETPLFHKGEIVLCYEPDKSKARVLYTSKVNTHAHTHTRARIEMSSKRRRRSFHK